MQLGMGKRSQTLALNSDTSQTLYISLKERNSVGIQICKTQYRTRKFKDKKIFKFYFLASRKICVFVLLTQV